MTKEELYESDRGERAYYESKRSLKERLKLPVTRDGCETILEIVTAALEIPFDELTRQQFAGWVHHLDNSENSFTLGDLGKYLWNKMAKTATWTYDQESKERQKAEELKPELTLAKDANGEDGGHPDVQ
jgi:hypothetical protein